MSASPGCVLLDTHVLLWARAQPERLSDRVRDLLVDGDNFLLWSAASSWELAIKLRIGKLRLAEPLPKYLARVIREMRLRAIAVEHPHAWRVAELPEHHRDPFDRVLVAQAQLESVPILSADRHFDRYDVERIW